MAAAAAVLVASVGAVVVTSTPAQASGPAAIVGMPFDGEWAYNVNVNPPYTDQNSSHPSVHHLPGGGNWSTDLYANTEGAAVKLNVTGVNGNLSFSWGAATTSCGSARRVNITVGNTNVGWIYIAHLSNAASTANPPTNGMTLGTLNNLGCNPGQHVHIEFQNSTSNACYVDKGNPGVGVSEGGEIGVLGSTESGTRKVCGSLPTSGSSTGSNYILTRQGTTMYAKAALGDSWSTLTGQASDFQVAGNRFAYLTSWKSLFVKEGMAGEWSEVAGDVDQYVITSTYIVTRKGSTMYAKAGLGDAWSTLTGSAADIKAAGERFAYRTSSGDLYVKQGLGGTWFWQGSSVDQYVITPNYVAKRSGSTMYAKAALDDAWSTLTGQAADIQVAGDRFAHLTSWGSLFVKEGLGGGWSELAGDVNQYVITAQYIVIRKGSTMYAKAGMGDDWSTLTGQAADIQVVGNRFAYLTSWNSLFVKEGLGGGWSELAGSVDQYLLTAG